MITIVNGEDRRRVTRGAFETYFKDIGYEIEGKKVAKQTIEQVADKSADKQVDKQPANGQVAQTSKYNSKNNKNKK